MDNGGWTKDKGGRKKEKACSEEFWRTIDNGQWRMPAPKNFGGQRTKEEGQCDLA